MMVVCVLVPRFSLIAACAERRELLGEPAALAPEPGGDLSVGEVSGAAEAHGVRAGTRLGEALARCPDLVLVPPDPGRAAELWEKALRGLEGIGAAVESERAGEAFFRADGLRGLHGGLTGTLAAARRAVGMPARTAAAPTRFAAFAAASARARPRAGARRQLVIPPRELRAFLFSLPVGILASRLGVEEREAHDLVTVLERLGIEDLGALATLPAHAVADRFGPLGLRGRRLARGEDDPPRPRDRGEEVTEALVLPEAVAGEQLDRALELLVDRLLAAPGRRGRTVRALCLDARLAGGGSWSSEVVLRRPSASAEVLCLVLAPKLAELPGPAEALRLRAKSLGPPGGDQLELSRRGEERRRQRLSEALRQVRAAAGPAAMLKVLEVDPGSRVPERWAMLAPYPER
jgi:protein ImuB